MKNFKVRLHAKLIAIRYRKTKWLLSLFLNYKVTLWVASYSACVVYNKTIIHLSVGESGGYLPSLW